MRKLFAVAAIALALACGGWTTHIVKNRPGGELVAHIAEFKGWEDHNDRVKIDGECDSACTLMLGIINPDHICTTSHGLFGFHSASNIRVVTRENGKRYLDIRYSEDGTRLAWFFYEQPVRDVLANHGWPEPTEHPEIILVKATEILPTCKGR